MRVNSATKGRRVETVSQQVLEYIRDGIFTGRYPVGYRIDQQSVADELGVSVIPVRECLRQLQAEGLLENLPYRGSFVKSLSLTELRDIYVTRETLEELAARLAVERLTSETLRSLESHIAEMERATEDTDLDALFALNRSFHFTLYEASQNSILVELIEGLWDRSTIYRRMFTFMPDRATQALEEHKRILAACQAGDGQGAGQATRDNVAHTTRAIIARREQENAAGTT
ncbi:MAG: GntR family transcriptional regulator [Anaerolineae bacterium]